jgi:hypothetical protein
MSISPVKCYPCNTPITGVIHQSGTFQNLALCTDCHLLFREFEPNHHPFLAFLSVSRYHKYDKDRAELPLFPNEIKLMTKSMLVDMVKEENEWRLKPETQEIMSKLEEEGIIDWITYVIDYQNKMVTRYGFHGEFAKNAVNVFQRVRQIFSDKIFETPIYVKYNRAGHCLLKKGDMIPNMTLHDVSTECKPVQLHGLLNTSKPVLVIGGSYT